MKVKNPHYPNFLDKKDNDFALFTVTLDNLFKQLRKSGVGASFAHTENISKEVEEKLWSTGVLNVENPKGLLQAVFYACGKCFVSVVARSIVIFPFLSWSMSKIQIDTSIMKMLRRTNIEGYVKCE